MQEISSFNPVPSEYENFHIQRGDEMLAQRGAEHGARRRLAGLRRAPDVEVVLAIGARAGSAGLLSAAAGSGFRPRLLDARRAARERRRRRSISRCTAPWAPRASSIPKAICSRRSGEMPAPHMPIVISLDLHGILTDRMLRQIDGLAIYHTYPHVDFADTGARAARAAGAASSRKSCRPVIARVVIPALVRGDELITKYRLLRRSDPRGAAARTRRDGARGRHHDRQPIHRRAGTVQPGAGRDGRR